MASKSGDAVSKEKRDRLGYPYVKLLLALVIVLIIMLSIFIIGYYFQNYKVSSISSELQIYQQSLEQLQLSASLAGQNSTVACTILKSDLGQVAGQVQSLSNQVQETDLTGSSQYNNLVAEFMYERIDYWLLGQRIADQCRDNMTTVLFFYNPVNCNSCVLEGNELSFLSQNYTNLIVSAVDGSFSMPLISILNNIYNLTPSKYPSIVINSKYVVEGFQNTTQIKEDLCRYTNSSMFCG
ncbi:MAG: hypothetical protein OH316_02645 [Candidatus Parvarchaeota archaeon]|nr:hypothetical protein [Candidatus Parvarchaeota archaeon]